MKTPKRDYKTPANQLAQESRWKRKNRVAQLKRIIEKYKYGTHLSGDVAVACRRLQCLERLGKHVSATKLENYLNELRKIQEHITCEITNAAIIIAFDAERKEKARKEQK